MTRGLATLTRGARAADAALHAPDNDAENGKSGSISGNSPPTLDNGGLCLS